ncbi:4-hydroxy-tetrahydrodipicolinate synthase [Paractinoplanes brasiliensis]|uniref:4-hydroxy-tetrahydrodipicolinate synthase n=1 Tax=Paractinoplanes brasiliensis TaxID=52695 RepID=A0A4R6J9Q7_9ACTN|nr:dihydrodipicolinate synthase family protein [Actinoplanes brasiliensis]TDO31957.1 4-hydroxy-tetrahydrodipicolinate synthase [Actinoplanes brasiliensis]GID28001.1 4-hydroxy-tetrahydrodipicolinate synthase [Actinoplanes brasiliensis]
MITPFAADGSVALAALEQLAHDVLDGGAAGLVALGTTAEPSALSPAEQSAVLELLGRVSRDRSAQLIAGGPVTPESATAALTLVPPFVRPGEDGVVAYLASVARRSPVPLVVYHVPYRTAQPLSAGALRRIAALPGVAGIKLAAGGIDADVIALMADPPPGFAILGGDDVVISPLLALGAHGGILASAHIETGAYASLMSAWEPELGHRLARLSAALFAEPNPTVIKAVLHAQGRVPTPDVRLPLLPAARESLAAVPFPSPPA